MTTSGPIKGITTGGFFPDPASAIPDYPTAGELQPPAIDSQGNLAIRGPVLTDEGGTREPFAAAPAAPWVLSAIPAGGSRQFVDSVCIQRLPLAPVAGTSIFVSRTADYLPVILNALLGRTVLTTVTVPAASADPFNISGLAATTIEAFFGLYKLDVAANPGLDPDHATAQMEFCEWAFQASTAAGTAMLRTRSHAGLGGDQPQPVATVAVTSRATAGWRSIALDGESALFRDGATQAAALPPPTSRSTLSGQIPGLYTELFLSFGIRVGATPGVPLVIPQLQVDTVYLKNLDRLIVNTGF